MKKILFIQHCAAIGGGSWCLLEIIQGIDRSTYEVEVLLGQEGPLRHEFESMGVKVHTCFNLPVLSIAQPSYQKITSLSGVKNFLLLPVRSFRLRRVINKIKPDVVYLNSIVQFVIGYLSKQCGVPQVILHIREHYCLPARDPRAFLWKKIAAQYIDQIIAIAKSGAELAGVAHKAKVARDWADFKTRGDNLSVDIFKKYGIPRGRPMVLLTGGSSKQKGSPNTVQAFLEMKDKKSICVILGGGKYQEAGGVGKC